MSARHYHTLAALVVVLAVGACKGRTEEQTTTLPPATTPPASVPSPTEVVQVVDVDLGNAIGADKRVTAETDDFKPTETVYAVVSTQGTATNTPLTARWTFQDGQTVEETTQNISVSGPAVTEFHVSKVEILLNGASVQTKEFEVKK